MSPQAPLSSKEVGGPHATSPPTPATTLATTYRQLPCHVTGINNPPHATSDNGRQVTDPLATTDEDTRRGLKVRMRKAMRTTAKGPRRGGGGGFRGGVQPTRRPGFRLFASNNNEGRDFPPAVSTKETGRCATHTPPLFPFANPTICR